MDELQLRRMMSAVFSLQAGYLVSVPRLPDPGPQYQGQLLIIPGGSGVADAIKVCRKKADGTWEWLDVTGLVTQSSFDAKFHGTTGHKHTGADGDGAVIGEYGSNANGEWIKHPNGVMECWGEKTETVNGANNYHTFGAINFPQPFAAPPVISAMTTSTINGHAAVSYQTTTRTTTAFTVSFIEINGTAWGANVASTIMWRAIGRWK